MLPVARPSNPENTFAELIDQTSRVHQKATFYREKVQAGRPLFVDQLLSVMEDAWSARQYFLSVRDMPGLAERARTELEDPQYDLAAAIDALNAKLLATVALLRNALPSDGAQSSRGYIARRENASGKIEQISYTAAQLTSAGFVQSLDDIIAAIES